MASSRSFFNSSATDIVFVTAQAFRLFLNSSATDIVFVTLPKRGS